MHVRPLAILQGQNWLLQVFLSGIISDCLLSYKTVLAITGFFFLNAYQTVSNISTMVLDITSFPFWKHIRPLGIFQVRYMPLRGFISGCISHCLLYSNDGTGNYGFSFLDTYQILYSNNGRGHYRCSFLDAYLTVCCIPITVLIITGIPFSMYIRPLAIFH